jgi:Bacterial Ig-like domain (group 3)/MBG domain (YGX type)
VISHPPIPLPAKYPKQTIANTMKTNINTMNQDEAHPPFVPEQRVRMKLIQAVGPLMVACCLATQSLATDIPVTNGQFNMYKPGTDPVFTVTGTFPSAGQFIPGAFGLGMAVGGGSVNFSDSSTGTTVDVPGWTTVRGGGDLYVDGFDGPLTPGFHGYGSWGGQTLIETAAAVSTVAAGQDYTITVQVGGPSSPADGPIDGLLEFNLLANGVALTPTGSVNVPDTVVAGTWYTMSRTYSASSLVGNLGQDLKIQVGVDASNSIGNRVVFDNVTLASSPADTTPPTLLSMVDNKSGGPVVVNEPVTYTVTFSEPMAAGTVDVTDFANTSATAATVNSVSTTLDPAVFTVVATPTEAGTLQLQIVLNSTLTDLQGNPLDTDPAILDDTTIVVNDVPPTPTTTTVVSSANPSTYGQNVTFTATVDPVPSGGTVQFYNGIDYIGTAVAVNTITGQASVSTSTLGATTHAITAEYSGNFAYATSTSVALSQVVDKAPLTVTASPVVRQPNTANPDPLPYVISGFQNGEVLGTSGVTGAPELTTTAVLASPVGTYPITCGPGTLAAGNYSFTLVDGTLTVTNYGCQLGVLNLGANGGINPATGNPWTLGDTYRLIFVTSTDTPTTSTDIADYNTFVQGLANAAGLGTSPLGPVTWKVVGSTATVDARDNTSTNPGVNGTGEPIVRMDGTFLIANNYADLWNGIVASHEPGQNFLGVHLDENGAVVIDERVRTGSNADGTASATQMLGAVGDVQTGRNYAPDFYGSYGATSWIADWRASGQGRVYALSGVLTIIETTPPGFSSWADANGATGQTPQQDHDNDGVQNGVEYFMGETGSSFTAMPSLDGSNTIAWTMDPNYQGTYEVQTSSDLGTWTNVVPKPLPSGGRI